MPTKPRSNRTSSKATTLRTTGFARARLDPLFVVLDAVAWMDAPTCQEVAQFADIDRRTAAKLLKNAIQIGLADRIGKSQYTLVMPYPYRGSIEQKRSVVREALVKLPLLASVRQFMALGDPIPVALRKAATVAGITPYKESDFTPLLQWAETLSALGPRLLPEDLLNQAEQAKAERHRTDSGKIVAFLSHSSHDKPFIRQLAGDLSAAGIGVWLDEQRIRVGDSIPERIAQGLAESDYFLIAVSARSSDSPWVQRELNSALVGEIEKRKTTILPLKLDDSEMPGVIADKLYADFSRSYRSGLQKLLAALKEPLNE